MMVEQPVRVGDFIELEGFQGTVEMIGTRSTIVRTIDNKELIVPNSFFLEKAVLNWTLNDNIVRTSVVVGVAYGSPLRKVEELLLQAANEQPDVLKSRAPRAIFSDFGDSALVFTLLFWCQTGSRYVSEIESDLRFRIDDLFRKNDITIPFPQRDVHVLTHGPFKSQS